MKAFISTRGKKAGEMKRQEPVYVEAAKHSNRFGRDGKKGQKQGLLVCHLLLYWSSTSFGLLLAFITIEERTNIKTHDWYSYEKIFD